jgi:hypothetical protein
MNYQKSSQRQSCKRQLWRREDRPIVVIKNNLEKTGNLGNPENPEKTGNPGNPGNKMINENIIYHLIRLEDLFPVLLRVLPPFGL